MLRALTSTSALLLTAAAGLAEGGGRLTGCNTPRVCEVGGAAQGYDSAQVVVLLFVDLGLHEVLQGLLTFGILAGGHRVRSHPSRTSLKQGEDDDREQQT